MSCYSKSATSHQMSSSRLYVLPNPTPFSIVTSYHCFKLDTFKKSIQRTTWPSLTSPKANATDYQDCQVNPKINALALARTVSEDHKKCNLYMLYL